MNNPRLVMVHGLVGSLHYFDPAARIGGARVQCCDLLGYGRYRNVDVAKLTLDAQADHLAGYLDELGGGPAWLLGHSMGGAVVMLVADRRPELVAGIINVEGNFTLKDAFWSSKIIRNSPAEWAAEYLGLGADVAATARNWGVRPTPQHLEWMEHLLSHQPPETVYAMSRAIVAETGQDEYLRAIRRVIKRGLPIHLVAGEKSAGAWDLPDFVRTAAVSYTVQPQVGHLMMLEEPAEFCRLIDALFAHG